MCSSATFWPRPRRGEDFSAAASLTFNVSGLLGFIVCILGSRVRLGLRVSYQCQGLAFEFPRARFKGFVLVIGFIFRARVSFHGSVFRVVLPD